MYNRPFLDKFKDWIDRSKDPDGDNHLSWAELGIREDAPESAKKAYAKYLEHEKRRIAEGWR